MLSCCLNHGPWNLGIFLPTLSNIPRRHPTLETLLPVLPWRCHTRLSSAAPFCNQCHQTAEQIFLCYCGAVSKRPRHRDWASAELLERRTQQSPLTDWHHNRQTCRLSDDIRFL